jgi:tetratricopeptide (TPR) repeat protein
MCYVGELTAYGFEASENSSTASRNCYMKNRYLYILITIVITLYLQTSCSTSVEGEPPPPMATQVPITELVRRAESLFAERRDIEKLRTAYEVMSYLRDPAERSYEVEWKFARMAYFLGKQAPNDPQSESILERGKQAGAIASRIEPKRPEGHFWFAANLGELGKRSPVTVGVKVVDDIREAMNTVISIQPNYEGASAYDALAQVEMATRIFDGKAEKAVEHLEKGIAVDPNNPNLRVNLAEAYFAVKRDTDARKQIDELMKLPVDPDYQLEHEAAIAKARKLLATSF